MLSQVYLCHCLKVCQSCYYIFKSFCCGPEPGISDPLSLGIKKIVIMLDAKRLASWHLAEGELHTAGSQMDITVIDQYGPGYSKAAAPSMADSHQFTQSPTSRSLEVRYKSEA